MKHLYPLFLLIGVLLFACDVRVVENETFVCDGDQDCLPGYVCLFSSALGPDKYCLPDTIDVGKQDTDIKDIPDDGVALCEPACESGTCCLDDAQSVCIDTDTSIAHCGGCGVACGPGERCVNGICLCGENRACDQASGLQCCGGSCAKVDSALCSCGGQGPCAAGQTCCGETCVDVTSDPNNCGGCGIEDVKYVCALGSQMRNAACIGGQCIIPKGGCNDTFADCNNSIDDGCEASLLSPNRCGSCDVVCSELDPNSIWTCRVEDNTPDCARSGCKEGFAACDNPDLCQSVAEDEDNCGDCDVRCGVGGECALGSCDEVIQLDGGRSNTCLLRRAGAAVCWGANNTSQLGYSSGSSGSTNVPSTPVESGGLPYQQIDVGPSHTCAITAGTGALQCWGANDSGELGVDPGITGNLRALPIDALSATDGWTDIAVGMGFSCAHDGVGITCWGDNTSGKLGHSTSGYEGALAHTAAFENLTPLHLEAGNQHVCAVFEDSVSSVQSMYCWGSHSQLQLGPEGGNAPPALISTLGGEALDIVDIALGTTHTCAIHSPSAGGRQVWCWGSNSHGQIGAALTETKSDTPTQVTLDTCVPSQIEAGRTHTCVLCTDGALQCWGNNDAGQLGRSTVADADFKGAPVTDSSGTEMRFNLLGIGDDYTCGRRNKTDDPADHFIYCWGTPGSGVLGIDNTSPASPLWSPRQIPESAIPSIPAP